MSKTRMGKRVASLLLSLVMMLSLLPTTVYAEGADTGDTTDEIVGQATTSGDNTEGTGEPEPTGEGEDGSANVTEGEDGAATNDAVVEETIAPVNAEGVDAVANAESSGDEAYVAQVGEKQYTTLQAAFDAANTDDTVTLLRDITLTEQVNITKALNGLTLDGNNKTITCATTTDPLQSGGSALYFGNASDKLYCTGIKIRDLTMTGTARFAIFLCGGTTTEFTNVNISGNYYIAVNLYGTHGATMTNCNISNSTTGTDEYISGVWSNVASQNPLELVNSKVDVIAINTYTTANTLAPKIFIDKDSSAEIHTFDDGSVSGNKKLCVSTESEGTYTIKEYVETTSTWVEVKDYVAEVNGKTYETLAAAIKAANAGATVTLLADVNLTSAQTISKQLTINLNGKTISSTAYQTIKLNSNADLTVKDSAGGGKIANNYSGSAYPRTVYLNGAGAALTLESGTIESNPNLTSLQSVAISSENKRACTVNIKGGSVVVHETATQGRSIVASTESMTLNISGGTITGGLHGVDAYSGSTVNITGGTITARYVDTGEIKEAYGMRLIGTAKVTVDGGEITGVKMDNNGYELDVPNVTLKSGTVNGSFYSITKGTIVFTVDANATIKLANDSAQKFLPSTVELAQNEDGTYTVKQGTYVAETNGGKYESLAEAITAAESGDTVTLLTDCASDRINLEKSITVDLNGKVLTSTAEYGVMFCAKNGKTITINGTAAGSKLVGTLMVTNGTYGHIVINGGTYESDKYCPIYINGAVSTDDSTLTVTNATIKALAGNSDQDNGVAVYLAGYSTSTFTNTTITAPVTGLEIRAGKLTLTDCNVTGGNGAVAAKADGSGSTVANAAVAISQHTTKKDIDVTITGGTYTATAAVYQTDVQKTGSENVKASIESGTFNGTVYAATNNTVAVSGGSFSSAVPENCCADGYIPAKNEGGTYGVKEGSYVAETNGGKYETLQAAIDAAARSATVKLLADTRENVTISTPYLTLDLNGFTLNGSTGERKPALTITARVTVMDSSEGQTGTIMREDTAENSGVSSHYVIDIQGAGWLTFESGNVKNDSGAGGTKGASLVRVGDDSVDKYPGLNIKGGTFTQDNFIVIKVDSGDLFLNGGTLSSKNSYAIENWHRATVKGGTVNGTVAAWTYSGGHNSDLEIIGGTINGNVTSVNYGNAENRTAKVSITGGTVNGELDTRSYDPTTGKLTSITDAAKATIEVTGGTFKNDPTKYVVEDSAVNQNADGTFGVAKAYLARIGETFYYTMDEAFKAQTASGEAIVLLRDYTTGGTFNSGSINRTVDLNGHTWTYTGTNTNDAAFEINHPNVTLTVKNGTVVSNSMVGLIPSAMGGTIKYDNSGLVLDGVTATANGNSGIETNGNNTNDAVTLKNSTLNVPNGFGIYFPSSGMLTIDNSTITAKTMGVQVCAGSLSINEGSAITVTGDAVPKIENDGAIQDGAAISIVNRTGYKGLDNVTVTGGTFTAKTGNAAIKAYDWKDNTESAFTANDKVFVSGGTFSSVVPEGLCKDGYISVANGDGTHTVKKGQYVAQVGNVKYESLAEAIAAAQSGQTVTLLKDIDLPATAVVKGKTITLDLNGKTISNSTDIWNESKYAWSLISVRDNGDLTINDTTGGGTLKAKENDCFALDVYAYDTKNVEDTKLTINAGNYVGNISAVYAFTGKATINGGHFSIQQKESGSDPYRLTLNCYDSSYTAGRAGFTVNGGTFENFDPRNNPAEGAGTSFVAESVGVDKNTDGTFTAKPDMAAQIVDAGGGSVAAYATLAEAIAAAQDGETVKLLADVNENVEIAAGKNLTLDLGGKTLNGGIEKGKAALTNHGTITITDSSEGKTGTIKRDDNGTAGYYVIRNQGKMTIESGSVINNSGYRETNPTGSMVGSSLICNGDCDKGGTLTIKGGTFTQDNFIAIKNGALGVLHVTGGTITSKHSAIQNWFKADITGGEIKGQLWTDAYKKGESVGETKIGGNAKFNGEIVMDIYGSVAPTLEINGGNLEVTNWWITTTAANAGAKPAVSGGTFSSKVPPEYCAVGYIPANNGDGTYTVKEGKYVIEVTSRIQDTNQTVATPTGGGQADYGEEVTVTTYAVTGFTFLGWYDSEGKQLSTKDDMTYTHKVTGDCTLIAKYAQDSTRMFRLTVNGTVFTVNERTEYAHHYSELASGSRVAIVYTGTDNFLYWVNASKNVVTTNKTLEYTMVNDAEFTAVTAPATSDSAIVVFKNNIERGQELQARRYYSNETIVFPATPSSYGKTFAYWAILDTNGNILKDQAGNAVVATESAIKAKIAEGTGYIVVAAVYTANGYYKATAHFVDSNGNTVANDMVNANVPTGSGWQVTAPDVKNKFFSHWKDADDNVLSTNQTYAIYAMDTVEVTAVYVDTENDKHATMNTVKLTALTRVVGNSHDLGLVAQYDVASGKTINRVGILFTTNANYKDSLTLENKKALTSTPLDNPENNSNVYRHWLNGINNLSTVVYARAYVTTTDGETIYSEVIEGSFNSWNGN